MEKVCRNCGKPRKMTDFYKRKASVDEMLKQGQLAIGTRFRYGKTEYEVTADMRLDGMR